MSIGKDTTVQEEKKNMQNPLVQFKYKAKISPYDSFASKPNKLNLLIRSIGESMSMSLLDNVW